MRSSPLPKIVWRYLLNYGRPLISFLFLAFIISSQAFGQAANIDQIRNGPANNPSKNSYDEAPFDDNPTWVNGNAGASNAHYVEGMSIAYRALITGLTVGKVYEYVIQYDTKHSDAMAIDYLTHYQRLQPHSPFGHTAEVINPLIFENGSDEYLIGLVSGPLTTAIPQPGPVPTPVAGMPENSFNDLPATETVMTIYNGSSLSLAYGTQEALNTSASKASTTVIITFTADKDSVLLAWGGHIASRLDWGYTNPPTNTIPRSAGGISGSPYHMRHLSMRNVTDNVNISLGNQDRSLSAAAVVPPPECPTVPNQTICAGSPSMTFTISNPDATTTYTWAIGSTNTAGAVISGSATGTSVTLVKSGGGNFTSGSVTLDITAVKNSISQTCTSVATGNVEVVVVNAAASPTTIDIKSAAHNTTLTATIDASSTDPNQANYTYLWEIVGTAAGTLSNATSRIATYTAHVNDAGQTINFKVTATQVADPNSPECTDDATTSVSVNVIGVCGVTDNAAVCAGTEVTHTASPNPIEANTTYKWTLEGEGGSGTTTATIDGADNGVTVKVIANSGYRIVLTQTYANTDLTPSVCSQDVPVTATPSVSATYVAPDCHESTFKVTVNSPTTGFSYDIDQPGNNINFTPIVATAGNPVEFTGLTPGHGWTVTVTTGGPGCTASTSCATNNQVPLPSNAVVDPESDPNKVQKAGDLKKLADNVTETYNINLPSGTKVKALPNPYTERVRFNLVSGVSGMATLEIHNTLGQKVAVVYNGYIQAGKELSKEYFVPVRDRGTLVYVFRVGDQKVSGKLISTR